MLIRPIEEPEIQPLGDLIVAAYRSQGPLSDQYAATLRDVASRVRSTTVLVAVNGAGELLGGVTYVGDSDNEYAEFTGRGDSAFRMLAVDPTSQGGGVGRALVEAVIERARSDGKQRLTLITAPWMEAAHRLYARMGFVPAPELDIVLESGTRLRGYALELRDG
jgi:GNAT superfamily N-acetyltransferase